MRIQGTLGAPLLHSAAYLGNDGLGVSIPTDPSQSLFIRDVQSDGNGGDRLFLGHSISELRQTMRAYQGLSSEEKIKRALLYALEGGKISDGDPLWLTCSPFGWHAAEFLELLEDSSLGLNRPGLIVVDYGAGRHLEYRFAVKAFQEQTGGRPVGKEYAALHRAEKEIFQAKGAVYEPKGLMGLFCAGEKRGHVYVVEQDAEIGSLMRSQPSCFLNSYEVYAGGDPLLTRQIEAYWGAISQGRHVRSQALGQGFGQKILRAQTFDLSLEEIARLHFIQADLTSERVFIPGDADLSVWLDSHYFMEPSLAFVAFCRVIQNTKVGGYILADMSTETAEGRDVSQNLGLRMDRSLNCPMKDRNSEHSFLFQKTQEMAAVTALSQVEYHL